MNVTTWSFSALDTWFFRESRPHGTSGSSELSSLFPPPARTVAGAVRFLMGERLGVDWKAFGRRQGIVGDLDLIAEIGFGDDLGKLRLHGPWLVRKHPSGVRERLYPAPAFLLARAAADRNDRRDSAAEPLRLVLGPAEDCDLGRVRLPAIPASQGVRAKALRSTWLTGAGLERVLLGALPERNELVDLRALTRDEPRLGIARHHGQRTHLEGMLYQTRHLRPVDGLSVEVDVEGVDERLLDPWPWVRLGGEGRLAAVRRLADPTPFPHPPSPLPETCGLILCLLTPADCAGSWLPPGFEVVGESDQGARTWRGSLGGVELEVHAAVLGKTLREGGWDLARHRPRQVRSLVPAGSAWYCTVRSGSPADAIRALHGASVGVESSRALGRGRVAVALWNSSEDLKGESTPS